MIAQAPDSTYFAEIQRKLSLFVARFPEAQRGLLKIGPEVRAFFSGVPEATLKKYLAEFGCMGEAAQLDVLVPLYLALRPGALAERKPLAELSDWLRGKGCNPTAMTLVRFLFERDLYLGDGIHPTELAKSVAGVVCEHTSIFDEVMAIDGTNGLFALVRKKTESATVTAVTALLTLYPVKLAGRTKQPAKRRSKGKLPVVEVAKRWLLAHPTDPVELLGETGFVAAMAKAGLIVRGNAADALVRSLGRVPADAKRVSAETVKDALQRLLGGRIDSEIRKISGVGGLTHRILELGIDAGPDVVKRAYLDLGGKVMPCPKEQGADYKRNLPVALLEIRAEHPEFLGRDIPVRGRGGLKELVWAKGVKANHETIRKYAEQMGFSLAKAKAA